MRPRQLIGAKGTGGPDPAVDAGRRRVVLGLGAMGLAPLASAVLPGAASAQLKGTQREGTIAPIPIAIPEFFGEDRRFSTEVTNVISADLERSGLFRPIDPASFIERLRDHNTAPRFQDWRVINA